MKSMYDQLREAAHLPNMPANTPGALESQAEKDFAEQWKKDRVTLGEKLKRARGTERPAKRARPEEPQPEQPGPQQPRPQQPRPQQPRPQQPHPQQPLPRDEAQQAQKRKLDEALERAAELGKRVDALKAAAEKNERAMTTMRAATRQTMTLAQRMAAPYAATPMRPLVVRRPPQDQQRQQQRLEIAQIQRDLLRTAMAAEAPPPLPQFVPQAPQQIPLPPMPQQQEAQSSR